ncbi:MULTISPECIES: hypothetical protein [Geobacter]|uniref:Uncharacterized protein n=2 Tax=Geobacter TaxID=28231 RepID=A0A0C1U5J2_9BACT|nr:MULTISPECIES: hypothetical protein [Geobacter]ANA40895.1 hypothetical protein A2G06_12125 [Geobacter anodireducens]KIE42990.1 hypothetical protein SE37_10275 [Geobacter soli]MBE2886979.1 hypothetical protein [Geobacter anodireducens]HMN02100.1 hypothetical protein [Geobacter anodireducens]
MGMVPIDNLDVGMTLAADVIDRTGRLLLGAGAELTAKHLHIFRTWGVAEADIDGLDDDPASHIPQEISPAELAAAEEALRPLFLHTDLEHPAMREIMRLGAVRKAMHGAS